MIPTEIFRIILKFSAASAPANYRKYQLINKEWYNIIAKIYPSEEAKLMFLRVIPISGADFIKKYCSDVTDMWGFPTIMSINVLPNSEPYGISCCPWNYKDYYVFHDGKFVIAICSKNDKWIYKPNELIIEKSSPLIKITNEGFYLGPSRVSFDKFAEYVIDKSYILFIPPNRK